MCVFPGDLWGLSSSASSLSPLAWRMNGPLSARPQPPPLVSLKLPFFSSSILPCLYLGAILSHHMLVLCVYLVIPTSCYPSSPLLTWLIRSVLAVFLDPALSVRHREEKSPLRVWGGGASFDHILTSEFLGYIRFSCIQISL